MSQREIFIECIAQTQVNRKAVARWMSTLGADAFEMPPEEVVSDPALVVALAGKRCYLSFVEGLNPNVNKIRKDYEEYFDNILKVGHGSVLEHAVFTYAIENVSRVFTAEMNRHRAGMAISEGSLRFIRFNEEVPYWLPLSLRDAEGDDEQLLEKKRLTRELFAAEFAHQEETYGKLVEIWDMDTDDKNFSYKKKVTSCLRRIIGMGVSTGGVWTGNVRALRHILTMRCEPAAEEEICHVFSRIAADMAARQPLLFGDFYQDAEGYWRPKYRKV
jgi:thymidylate synthase (FAD)